MSIKLYEVQEFNLCGGWANNWIDENGPIYFESITQAETEIDYFLLDCDDEVEAGNMLEYPDPKNFRIVEAQNV